MHPERSPRMVSFHSPDEIKDHRKDVSDRGDYGRNLILILCFVVIKFIF